MINILTILFNLTLRLYPTGRAFRVPFGSFKEKVTKGLIKSESDVYGELLGIYDEILPDNDNFTVEDARVWERRLAIRSNENTLLSDRKLAILRKYASPGNILARQHYLFLERELRLAGFDVYVHENRFDDGMGGYETRTPAELGFPVNSVVTFGDDEAYFGDIVSGGQTVDKIANFIDEDRDATFSIPEDLRATFFICGEVIGTEANIDANRKTEFRQLVLQVKPLHTVGYIYINYI